MGGTQAKVVVWYDNEAGFYEPVAAPDPQGGGCFRELRRRPGGRAAWKPGEGHVQGLDVIVVGAGPAGASAALHAARLGLRVLVLDEKKFPREKACGDALSSTSLACLEELGPCPAFSTRPTSGSTG
jgi:hypothetical protein